VIGLGKVEIVDDCLAPERYIHIKYSGPDPWGVVKKVSGLIRPYFHVSASGTSHYRLNWDRSDPENIDFFSQWWVKRDFSRYSAMVIQLKAQGKFNKASNEGEFYLQFHGDVLTEFKGWNLFVKPVWLMYSYLFYNKARRQFIDKCRESVLGFRNEIKEHFNIEATETGPVKSVLG
jgi:hypothetical protein